MQRAAAGAALLTFGPPRRRCGGALPGTQLRALRNAVRGQVLAPGDSGYPAARVLFNTRYDGIRPPAVVRVRDSADVQAVVKWADASTCRSSPARAATPTTAARPAGAPWSSTSAGSTPSRSTASRRDRPGRPAAPDPGAPRPPRPHVPGGLVPERGRRRPCARRRHGPLRPRGRPRARPHPRHPRRHRRRAQAPRHRPQGRGPVLGAPRRRRQLRHRRGLRDRPGAREDGAWYRVTLPGLAARGGARRLRRVRARDVAAAHLDPQPHPDGRPGLRPVPRLGDAACARCSARSRASRVRA